MSGAISDVAALAGVSKATASRALTGRGYVSAETRERVVQAAATIGYVASPIAASLSTGRTLAIGVLTSFLNRWYFGEVLEGAEGALRARGYDLTLHHLPPDSPERDRIFD
jgi:DNA-binding LacI/PurR family transcriptional regulator